MRRILLSAYACAPGVGSELGVGWEWTLGAAKIGTVTLLTRAKRSAEVSAELARLGVDHVEVVPIDLGTIMLWVKRRLPLGRYLYYAIWQVRAGRLAASLHREKAFDVVHHVTFAVDWMPVGVLGVRGLPCVWGPVGGCLWTPLELLRHMGVSGAAAMVVRDVITHAALRMFGRSNAKRASLVVAQNQEVLTALTRWSDSAICEPNAAIHIPEFVGRSDEIERIRRETGRRVAVMSARLIRWKGVGLAIDSICRPEASDWSLAIFGGGPDEGWLRARAKERGVTDRVFFQGPVSREEVLSGLFSADAFLFPSLHDSGPWAVAEAVSVGCPVVCLGFGGPAVLAAGDGDIVVGVPRGDLPRRLAEGLQELGRRLDEEKVVVERRTRSSRWSSDRLPNLLDRWYQIAADESSMEHG